MLSLLKSKFVLVAALAAALTVSAGMPANAAVTSAPRTISVDANGGTYVYLSWLPPLTDGGKQVTDYVLAVSNNGGVNWANYPDPVSTVTGAKITGLTPNTTYKVKVNAKNVDGYSASTSVSFTTGSGKPSTPLNVRTTSNTVSGFALAWDAPTVFGSAVTDYRVQYSFNNGSTWIVANDGVSANKNATVAYGSPKVLQPVRVKVQAVNSYGIGMSSSILSFSTPSNAVKPSAVTGFAVNYNGPEGASYSWFTPSIVGSGITDYAVSVSFNNGTTWFTLNDGKNTATELFNKYGSPKAGGTPVSVKIQAINNAGYGSSAIFKYVVPKNEPTYVLETTINENTSTTATMTWQAIEKSAAGNIASYEVLYSSDNGKTWLNDWSVSTSTIFKHNRVNSGKVLVSVQGVYENGKRSQARIFEIPAIAAGASVPNIPAFSSTGYSHGVGSIFFTWDVPATYDGPAVTDYVISYRTLNNSTWTVFEDDTTAVIPEVETEISGLTLGEIYEVRLQAKNSNGLSSPLNTFITSPVDTGEPNDILFTAVTSKDANTVSVKLGTWEGAPTIPAGVIGFEMFYKEQSNTEWTVSVYSKNTGLCDLTVGCEFTKPVIRGQYEIYFRAVTTTGVGALNRTANFFDN